ncbi:hypothetical protein LSCM4_07659 [Leishmania orientalis]|uniref:Uncharacterized protein n=1 Tax=Leishmania orientalis TaxID=2249476 RepID=A0A836HV90_9TRYP|nr:hypothetical protein LSCM4_07659 [Leishmania orientalis]
MQTEDEWRIDSRMPATLHPPLPLVHRGGSPHFPAPRAELDGSIGAATVATNRALGDGSTLDRQRRVPTSSLSSSPSLTPLGSAAGALKSLPNTSSGLAGAPAPSSSAASSRSASPASPSSRSSRPTASSERGRNSAYRRDRGSSRDADTLEMQRQSPPMAPMATQETSGSHLARPAADGAIARSVPLPLLVEQQRDRIRVLVQERDAATAKLSELHALFQRLHDDYEEATREADGLRLQLNSLRAHHETQIDENRLLRASSARQQQRIQQFDAEWASNSKYLREQLDTLASERDAIQAQRDACMADSNGLRQQLIQLQAEMHRSESKHREALRAQADTHAQQLRAAVQEKEEQLQARAAATRHEARLVQQELDQLDAGHTAAHEERESMRWRLSELETVVTKKEQLRAELERMVCVLRSRLTDQEEVSRQDAQRYAQRAQDLEQLYRGQVAQEQHRAQALQDDLAAARKATQEALRQLEALQQSHSEQFRNFAARASKLEDDLRQQLRSIRADLEEAQARALEHEAAARRSQRDADALRATCSSEQEARERLQQAHTAQAQQLSRAESSVRVLQTRLREKEREAELLRCAMEQTVWTREMRQAAHHTLASLLGVPRVSVRGGRHRRKGEEVVEGDEAETQGWPPTLQLEWAAEAQNNAPPPSAFKGQRTGAAILTGSGNTGYGVPEGGESIPSASEAEGVTSSSSSRGTAPMKSAQAVLKATTGSPQRPPATPTHSGPGQHVETIDRTAQRGTDRSGAEGHAGLSAEAGRLSQPPQSVRTASPLTSPPPLHPGTPRKSGAAALAQGSTDYAGAAYSTTPAHRGAGVGMSPFSSPLRALSLIPSHNTTVGGAAAAAGEASYLHAPTGVTSSQPISTPLLSRQKVSHVYNIPGDEQQHQAQAVVARSTANLGPCAADSGREFSLAQRPRPSTPLTQQRGEVFFDGHVCAPRARGVSAVMLSSGEDAAAAAGALVDHQRRTTSLQLATASSAHVGAFSTYVAPSPYRGSLGSSGAASGARMVQPSFSTGDSLSYDHGAAAPGVRAAELIAQLSRPSSAASFVAAAAGSNGAPAMQGGASNINSHQNVLSGGDAALQQYLRDTVQQVLADQGRKKTFAQELHHSLHQRFDGGSAIPAAFGYHGDGIHSAGEAEDDDFGSASRPRSSVAVPLVRPTPQPVPAVDFTSSGGASRMVGAGDSSRGDARRCDSERERSGSDGAAAATRSGCSATAAPQKTASAVSATAANHTRRREGGIAHTLEQLASRQQQLLQSLSQLPQVMMLPAAHDAAVSSSPPWQAASAGPHLSSLPYEAQHAPQSSGGAAVADAAGAASVASATLLNIDSKDFGRSVAAQDHVAASARYAKGSDGGTDVELDPRQLSYSTTAATTQLRDVEQEDQSSVKEGGGIPMVAAAATASVRYAPSVSDVSSLSQLERRFATPF